MLFRDVVSLITVTVAENNIGDFVETQTTREVFANKKGVNRSEFYQAAAVGLKPELIVEIREIDYADEKKLTYNSKEYNIIRTYPAKNECLELVCVGLVNS